MLQVRSPGFRRVRGILVVVLAIAAIELIRVVVAIPNPGVFWVLAVAIAAVLSGTRSAVIAAQVVTLWQAFTLIGPGTPIDLEPPDVTRILVLWAGSTSVALLVGAVQRQVEREHAIAAQLSQDARVRALTETASDAIITVDDRSVIRSVNQAAEAMFGYATADMVGRSLTTLMPDAYRERHLRAIRRYTKTGERTIAWNGIELVGLDANGREFPIEVSFGEYRFDRGARFTGIIRDISDRKRLESELAQAQKMDAVGRLAGGIAHDFNNLLTAILGYAELLQAELPAGSDARTEAEEIVAAGERARALTQQLLAFGRRQQLRPAVLDPLRALRGVEGMLGRLLGEDIELEVRPADSVWPIFVDPSQFDQVIVNLAINARDAMPSGGTLTIEAANAELDEAYSRRHAIEPGSYVVVAVSDTGFGIPPETVAHIFEPFFTTKGPGHGTGLGLATVYGIVSQSGGHIWVYSEPDRGSTFKVYFPRATGVPEPSQPPVAGTAMPVGAASILLAEDELSVRELVVSILERDGHKVTAAGNGEEALAILDGGPSPDLLITDVVMPGMSGPDLAAEVKRRFPGTRVLFLSGYTAGVVGRRGATVDPDLLLEKPFTPQVLRERVVAALSNGPPSDAAEPPPADGPTGAPPAGMPPA